LPLDTFRDALILAYCENPCQVLPNALWKTLKEINKFETSFKIENGLVTHLEAWNDESLYIYWSRDRTPPKIPKKRLDNLKFALVHQEFLRAFPAENFDIQRPYFRLIHKKRQMREVELPQGFHIANVDTKTRVTSLLKLLKNAMKT